MPSLATYPLQPPTDSKEYEKIVRDYCASIFGGNVYLFGRNGQCQNGVDIVSSHITMTIGVQCKAYYETTVTEKDIDEMIALAETFVPPLDRFVIAIAKKTDANIQRYVLLKSKERIEDNKFPVDVVYWDEVENYIKNNPVILCKYYPFLKEVGEKNKAEGFLVTEISVLRKRFLELYCRYRIKEVILSDIFVGIPHKMLENYTCFSQALYELLHCSCMLQGTDIYINIKSFHNAIANFMDYLGTLVTINSNGICTIVNWQITEEQDVYNVIIEMLRDDIISKFLLASELQEF